MRNNAHRGYRLEGPGRLSSTRSRVRLRPVPTVNLDEKWPTLAERGVEAVDDEWHLFLVLYITLNGDSVVGVPDRVHKTDLG